MTTYKLEVPKFAMAMMFVVFAIFTAMWLFLIGTAVVTGNPDTLGPGVFFLFMTVFWGFVFGRIPHRIEHNGLDDIRFVSLLRTVRTSAMQMQSLEVSAMQYGHYILRCSGDEVRMLIQFTGFYELLHEIKQANPSFTTKGI